MSSSPTLRQVVLFKHFTDLYLETFFLTKSWIILIWKSIYRVRVQILCASSKRTLSNRIMYLHEASTFEPRLSFFDESRRMIVLYYRSTSEQRLFVMQYCSNALPQYSSSYTTYLGQMPQSGPWFTLTQSRLYFWSKESCVSISFINQKSWDSRKHLLNEEIMLFTLTLESVSTRHG